MNIKHKLLSYLDKKCYQQHCKPLDTGSIVTEKVCKVYKSCTTLSQMEQAGRYHTLARGIYEFTRFQDIEMYWAYKDGFDGALQAETKKGLVNNGQE